MSSLGRLVPLATVIALCTLSFARSSGAIAQFSAHDDRTILVLGSGGVLGTALTGELLSHGYTILQVRNRLDIDLRLKGSLDIFNNETIDFCFFLASEWGDPKRTLQGGDTGVGALAAVVRGGGYGCYGEGAHPAGK